MHPLRQAQVLRRVGLLTACSACVLLSLSGVQADDPPGPSPPPKVKVNVKPPAPEPPPKPPERLPLPARGDHTAEDILTIAGRLAGRTIRIESERVRDTKVAISADLAGDEVTLAEVTLLLAAHKVYLFEVKDPAEGDILVASRNPAWKDEPPRFTRVLEVGEKNFAAAWDKVRKAVDDRNAHLKEGERPVVAVPDERTGKIVLGGPTEASLDLIASEAGDKKAADPDRPKLYTYVGNFRPVDALGKELTDKLSEGERNRVRIVVASRGNRLLLRAPPSLWAKVEEILKDLDREKREKPGK